MKYRVDVMLKKEILDPEARAILGSLQKKGFRHLDTLAISKSFHLELKDEAANDSEKIKKLTEEHLINPLSETYTITKLDFNNP